MEEKFIQIKDASNMLGVSKLTLRNWDKAGKLTAYRHPLNNYRVYKSEDIDHINQKIKSGEKPEPKKRSNIEPEKPTFFKLKVIHSKD